MVSKDVGATMGKYDFHGKTIPKSIPNCTLVEIPNVGHVPLIGAFDASSKPLLVFF